MTKQPADSRQRQRHQFYQSLLALLATALFISACAGSKILEPNTVPRQANQAEDVKLTVLHTNDHHGRFWKNKDGEYGMAARQTLVRQIREEVSEDGGYLLLLSGGDINTGVPESDLLDAEPDFRGMKVLGYDAMALGNHEFDNAMSTLKRQQTWVDFPFLSANIYYKNSERRVFQPYQIFQVGKKRVAVMGLTTEDTVKISNPEYVMNLDFRSPIAEAAKLVPELRREADYVIAVTHMGHYPNATHRNNAPGDVSLARAVDGIDMIVGGHTQVPLLKPDIQNNTYILQAFEWGKYLGRLDALLRADGSLELVSYKLIPVNLGESKDKKIPEDPEMLAMLQPYQNKGGEKLNVTLAEVDGKLEGDRAQVRFRETNLGNMLALAMQEKTGTDFAIMNSGGIRDSIAAGAISYRDVLTVQPFGNTLVTVDLSAAELQDYLQVVAGLAPGSGAFPQFSGISFQVQKGQVQNVMIGGKSVDKDATYRIAINSFVAAGGDGYPKLEEHSSYVNTGYVDAEALADYLRDKGKIAVADYAVSDKVTGIEN